MKVDAAAVDRATIAALQEEIRALQELAERHRQLLHDCHQRIAVLEAQCHTQRREP